MVTAAVLSTFLRVPVSSPSVRAAAGPAEADRQSRAPTTSPKGATQRVIQPPARAPRSLGRSRDRVEIAVESLVSRAQLAFPLGNRDGRDAVAQHVRRRAAHVQELVDADDEQE